MQKLNCSIILLYLLLMGSVAGAQQLSVSIISSEDVPCNGDSTGFIQAFATGGTPSYTYQWDDPSAQNTAFAANLPAGTWTVTVTDAMGDTASASQTIDEPNVLSNTISITDASGCGSCDGLATLNVGGGAPPFLYQWDDPGFQTTSSATGLCANAYSVVISDVNGCLTVSNITVDEPIGMTLSSSSTNPTSCGISDGTASVLVSGGITPYSYLWDDLGTQSTSTAVGLIAGGYSVSVTDSAGCVEVANVTISDLGAPAISITNIIELVCSGNNTGSATIEVSGGTAPFTYQWDDISLQTDSIATGLAEGTYNAMVTDANGCSSTESVSISSPSALTGLVTSSSNTKCFGSCDGSATITVNGGTTPYSYQWNPDTANQNSATAIGMCEGSYIVLVTDSSGCTVSDSFAISQPLSLSLDSVSNEATCNNSNGTAIVLSSGGTAPYSYLWQSGSTINVENNLTAGSYNCTVTDSLGCSESIEVIVAQSGSPAITATGFDVTCFGGNNGTANTSVIGGTAPFSYQWDDNQSQTSSTAIELVLGTYNVTVVDANNCIETTSVTLSTTSDLGLSAEASNENCGKADGTTTAIPSGGLSPFIYIWDDPNSRTSAIAAELSAGVYSVSITDGDGCVLIETIEIVNDILSCLVDIPNTFTPNDDGVNDNWEISGTERYPEIVVEVYNRWGSLIFSSRGYTSPWEGDYKGKELPMADYYYIITLGEGESFTGTITIMK
ncbi:MAG: hypothetical protein COB85_08060 [Bacteroidetes bacterium]|nr:MAG: hypothetical protein COB85_08060 [Bacteroidota bacterium]